MPEKLILDSIYYDPRLKEARPGIMYNDVVADEQVLVKL